MEKFKEITKEKFKLICLLNNINMLPKNKVKEGIGISYIKAICNKVGYNLAVDENDYGCDLIIRDLEIRDSGRISWSGFNLDVQVKCTENWREDESNIIFDLKNKNYNDLIQNRVGATKRILVVMLMPEEEREWLTHSIESLIIKKCAYWMCLKNMDSVSDTESTTAVRIPKRNIFSPNTVKILMEKIKSGEELND